MKRIVLMTVLMAITLSSSNASAQVFDPKEAIVGAWVLDLEHLYTQIVNETDEEKQQSMLMMASYMATHVWEIQEDGDIIIGGTPEPMNCQFEVDDEGLLWLLPKEGGSGMPFSSMRFESRDRFVMPMQIGIGLTMDLGYARLFPSGMLEEEIVNPETEKALAGYWEFDVERVAKMPWIESIAEPVMRNQIIESFQNKSESLSFGFADGGLFMLSDDPGEVERVSEYSIRAANENMIALSLPLGVDEDNLPVLVSIHFEDNQHINVWWSLVRMGPFPMVRRDDVTLP